MKFVNILNRREGAALDAQMWRMTRRDNMLEQQTANSEEAGIKQPNSNKTTIQLELELVVRKTIKQTNCKTTKTKTKMETKMETKRREDSHWIIHPCPCFLRGPCLTYQDPTNVPVEHVISLCSRGIENPSPTCSTFWSLPALPPILLLVTSLSACL